MRYIPPLNRAIRSIEATARLGQSRPDQPRIGYRRLTTRFEQDEDAEADLDKTVRLPTFTAIYDILMAPIADCDDHCWETSCHDCFRSM